MYGLHHYQFTSLDEETSFILNLSCIFRLQSGHSMIDCLIECEVFLVSIRAFITGMMIIRKSTWLDFNQVVGLMTIRRTIRLIRESTFCLVVVSLIGTRSATIRIEADTAMPDFNQDMIMI